MDFPVTAQKLKLAEKASFSLLTHSLSSIVNVIGKQCLKKNLETYGPYFSSMLVSASDWLKLIFEKVCGFAYIKITLSTNLDMHNRFQGSFCCDLPLQDLNLVSASGGMVTG